MQLTFTGMRFEARCSYSEKDLLKVAGFHWDHQRKIWWSGSTETARKFEQFADPLAKKKFNGADKQIQLSKAVNLEELHLEDYDIPVPDGLSYMPFQKAGILVMLTKFGFDIEQLKKK